MRTTSLSEIAENAGITRQGVRDAIKRAEAQMLEMEERLGLVARFRRMRDGFAEIQKAAGEIAELNDRLGRSREIGERARRIAALSHTKAEEYPEANDPIGSEVNAAGYCFILTKPCAPFPNRGKAL